MKKLISILTIFILVTSCKSKNDITTVENTTLTVPTDSTTLYFETKSDGVDVQIDALDSFMNEWFSRHLFSLKEPVLKDYKGDKEIYRFTWLRSFHHPVVIRLEKQDDRITIFTKVCDGAGGYEPRELIQDTNFMVQYENYEALLTKFNNADFWNLPTEKLNEMGLDGSEWIIESYSNNNYHLVVRWAPFKEKEKKFREIGEYLRSISKIEVNELIEDY